jgi:hypothetical protein
MLAGVEEVAEMPGRIRKDIRIGDANAIETQRARVAVERGLQIGGREFDGCVQKSRST